jgi:hypothetical protein
MTTDEHAEPTLLTIETREVIHPDGSIEIVRVLNEGVLGQWSPHRPLAFEKSIVWLQPITELDFVRIGWVRNATSRRGPLYVRDAGMVVGYSKLTADAPRDPSTKNFTRRLFYLTEEDLQLNLNQIPHGVFNPKTILPGVMGEAPVPHDLNRGYPAWVGHGSTTASPVIPTTPIV